MDRNAPSFLGRGWGFPPRLDLDIDADGTVQGNARTGMVADEDDIRESLSVLMSTIQGERLMLPEYGMGLQAHVFDPTDETSLGHLVDQIEHAILFFEPRIKVEEIDIDSDAAVDGCLIVRITYQIPAINSRANVVYPYYFREGTNIRAR